MVTPMKRKILALLAVLLCSAGALVFVLWKAVLTPPHSGHLEGPSLATVAEQSLPDIIKESQAIVIGKVTDISAAKFASDGNQYFDDALIYRDVSIKINHKLYDSLGLVDTITLPVLGGKIELPPEVLAKTKEPIGTIRVGAEAAHFEPGEQVLLCLKKGALGFKDGAGNDYMKDCLVITGAWQGKFEVQGDRLINHSPECSTDMESLTRMIKKLKT